MKKALKLSHKTIVVLQALLVYFAIFTDVSRIYPNIYAQPDAGFLVTFLTFFQRIDALWGDYSVQSLLCFLMTILVWFACDKWLDKDFRQTTGFLRPVAVIFSVLYLFADSYNLLDSAAYVCGDWFVFVVAVIRGIGFFLIFNRILQASYLGLTRLAKIPFDAHYNLTFPKAFLFISAVWLPQLLVIYPGGYCNDVQDQLCEFFGYLPMADPHPPLFTMIIGSCVWIGYHIFKSPNLGLFLYIIVQFLFMASGLAYCITFLYKRLPIKPFIRAGLCFFAFLPIFSHYASVTVKNAPYSTCLLWMAISAYELMEALRAEEPNRKQALLALIRYSVFSAIGSLICHNGIYIAISLAIVMIIIIVIHKIPTQTKVLLSTVGSIGILVFFLATKVIYPAMGIQKGMDHLIYTNMLQHTCRLYLANPEDFTDEDIKIISKVIDFDKIEDFYTPRTSDGIKPIVDLFAPDEDVAAYMNVWEKELQKHPLVLLDASFNVSYGFFAPVSRNAENDFATFFYASEHPEFNFYAPHALRGLRNVYEELLENFVSLPVVRLLENPGFYFWFLLFTLAVVLHHKRKDLLICFIPGIITAIYYVGIPAYYHHPRYAFPLVYSAILYIGLCLIAANAPVKTPGAHQ